jgi:hypothetical protein
VQTAAAAVSVYTTVDSTDVRSRWFLSTNAARIVRELVLLFKAVDEQQRADASPEAPRAVVSPNGLREALSHTAEFKLGAATASPSLCSCCVEFCYHMHHALQ